MAVYGRRADWQKPLPPLAGRRMASFRSRSTHTRFLLLRESRVSSWEAWHREVISRERGGILATVTRGALSAAAQVYETGVGWRNARFDRDANSVHRVSVPVVSIGNLTTGGTGKSPLVAWVT